jgi:hypothetical protein
MNANQLFTIIDRQQAAIIQDVCNATSAAEMQAAVSKMALVTDLWREAGREVAVGCVARAIINMCDFRAKNAGTTKEERVAFCLIPAMLKEAKIY